MLLAAVCALAVLPCVSATQASAAPPPVTIGDLTDLTTFCDYIADPANADAGDLLFGPRPWSKQTVASWLLELISDGMQQQGDPVDQDTGWHMELQMQQGLAVPDCDFLTGTY